MRSRLRELGRQLRMKTENIRFGIITSGDPGLIGHDEDKKPCIVKRLDRRLGSIDPPKAGVRPDVPIIVIEHAVAIEKSSRPAPPTRYFLPGARKSFRHSDIDEVAVEGYSGQLPVTGKRRKHLLLERTAGGESFDEGTTAKVNAPIDEAASRAVRTVMKVRDPLAVDLYDPKARRIVETPQRDSRYRGRLSRTANGQFQQVYIEPRITVEQQKQVVEAVPSIPYRPAGAGTVWLNRDLDLQAEPGLQGRRGRVAADLAGFEPGEEENPLHAVSRKFEHQYVEKGRSIDFKQRLWLVRGQISEPGPDSAAQNNRLPDHPNAPPRGNRHSSIRPQMMCAAVMWICCMSCVAS